MAILEKFKIKNTPGTQANTQKTIQATMSLVTGTQS
jgi:hypothetical protein